MPSLLDKAQLPERLKNEPEEVKSAWNKTYAMALKRFKNDTATATKAADKAAAKVQEKLKTSAKKTHPLEIRVEKIEQSDSDPNYFFGWGYICEQDGRRVTDVSGQTVSLQELEKSFYPMMLSYRSGRELHKADETPDVATVVEGVIFTPEKCDAMGMSKNAEGFHEVPYGAWLGFYVHDADVKAKVISGEYAALSIGGFAEEKSLQKHGHHDQSTHGNWAHGVGTDQERSARAELVATQRRLGREMPKPPAGFKAVPPSAVKTGDVIRVGEREDKVTSVKNFNAPPGGKVIDTDAGNTLHFTPDQAVYVKASAKKIAGASDRTKIVGNLDSAESYADLDPLARAYLDLSRAAIATEKLSGENPEMEIRKEAEEFAKPVGGKGGRHGPSIKCPDIYEALRREGKSKTQAAQFSNECHQEPGCNCH